MNSREDCATQPRGSFPGGIARPGTSLFLARVGAVFLGFGAPAVSLLVLAGAAIEIRAIDMHAVLAMVPRTPLFWLVFLLAYATPILADWLLYRRILRLPLIGLAPLTRKLVWNELVLSYAGDAYLYAWARRRGVAEAAAFRAVRDVAILSAVASNATTLVVAAIAMPFFGMIGLDFPPWAVAALVIAMLAVPMAALMLRDTLFLLPRRDLALALAVQIGRAALTMVLIALSWHLALKDVAPVWWLIFAALKLLVSRLAFISNRDLVLAGLSVLLLGPHAELAVLMTMIAALTICTHILAGTALLVKDVVTGAIHRVQPGRIDAAGVAPA